MSWLWMFIVGLFVGIVAKFLMPGKDPGGFIVTGLLGIAGMFMGGWLSSVIFGTHISATGSIEPSGFIGGVIGSLILLAIYRMFARNRVFDLFEQRRGKIAWLAQAIFSLPGTAPEGAMPLNLSAP